MANTDALGSEARELADLVVAYAKQETLDPLKRLGKVVAFGIIGSVLVGIGAVFLGLASVRALQTETDVFENNLSWIPYFIVAVALVVGAGLSWVTLGPGSPTPPGKKEKSH